MISLSIPSFHLRLGFSFIIIGVFFSTSLASDETQAIRLPTDNVIGDLCAGKVPAACPVTCFRPDPVCGVDGVTYWCGCPDAACSGTPVVKLGFCEVGNGGSGPVSGQALFLVHIVWLIILGFSVLFGFL